jgi:sec-independent protein translocase protein TatA
MFGLGMSEILVVLVIGLVPFGNRLPDLARSLGKSLTAFKKEVNEVTEEVPGLRK